MTNRIQFIERFGDARDGGGTFHLDLPADKLPKPVEDGALNLLEIVRVRAAALTRADEAAAWYRSAKASHKFLKTQAMLDDPKGAAKRAATGEADEADRVKAAAKRDAKAARAEFEAARDALPLAYGNLIGTVIAERQKWAESLRKDADKALIEVATVTKSIEGAMGRLEDAMGLLEMLAKIDVDTEEGTTPRLAGQPSEGVRAPLKGAVLNLHQTIGRAQARLREV